MHSIRLIELNKIGYIDNQIKYRGDEKNMGLLEFLADASAKAIEAAGEAFRIAAEAGKGLESALEEAGKFFGGKN